jgi:hypothetical protein
MSRRFHEVVFRDFFSSLPYLHTFNMHVMSKYFQWGMYYIMVRRRANGSCCRVASVVV